MVAHMEDGLGEDEERSDLDGVVEAKVFGNEHKIETSWRFRVRAKNLTLACNIF